MRGKANEMAVAPAKNFRIAAADETGDVEETAVAARTPDTPLSEVYAAPNAAPETAAIAATDAVVEAPQIDSAANGAAAANGAGVDRGEPTKLRLSPTVVAGMLAYVKLMASNGDPDAIELVAEAGASTLTDIEEHEFGDASDIAHSNDRFVPAVNKVAADSGLKIVTYLKRSRFFGDTWRKLDEKQQDAEIDGIYDLAKQICYGSVDAVASRGFEFVEMTLTSVKITLKEDGRKCEVAGTVRYDEAFVIDSVENKTIMMIPRNTNQFLGGQKVKPDVIGTLRLPDPELPLGPPISGPGTPTPAVVMDAVGKGPEAAAAAAAVVTAGEAVTVVAAAIVAADEPAPAPTTVA